MTKDLEEELKAWGHTGGTNGHLIMKCDNEPAIIALKAATKAERTEATILEESLVGEGQAN